MYNLLIITLLLLGSCKNATEPEITEPIVEFNIQFSPATFSADAIENTQSVIVSSNLNWTVTSSETWCTLSTLSGFAGETSLKISVQLNRSDKSRSALLTFKSDELTKQYTVTQEVGTGENYVPAGYNLVWSDDFESSKPALPDRTKWSYETGANGWGNNEIQNYIAGVSGTDTCALVSNGILKIIAKKRGSEVISIRMNSTSSWQYGYFEARLKVPGGKGTWPAFWMLPKNFSSWPLDGEIDIMEYVGYRPNVVQSSVHTMSYNHSIGTEKTATKSISNAETEFHVYAIEWSADKITGFVDGEPYFTFQNDKKNDKNTWPFNAPFYLKLNLAWGGNWGGSQGIDNTKLPATYEIDFVRVYQKQ